MRKSKSVGFVFICVGIMLLASAAVLPVSPATQRFGPFRVDIRGDNCGPTGYVVLRDSESPCREAAERRLLLAAGVSVLLVAIGMAMFAGGDDRRTSRIVVRTPRVTRRGPVRSPGGRRYRPG